MRIMSANAGRQLKELYGVSLEFLSSGEATNTNKARKLHESVIRVLLIPLITLIRVSRFKYLAQCLF